LRRPVSGCALHTVDHQAYIDGIEGRCRSVAPGRASKIPTAEVAATHFGRNRRGGNRNGKADIRRIDVGSGGADGVPLRGSGALLAVVFPVWPAELCSRLRIQQLGAVHGDRPRYRRLLLHQSVSPAAGAIRAIGKAASPHGSRLKRSAYSSSPTTLTTASVRRPRSSGAMVKAGVR
jgi:hypothetical protein